MPRFTFLLLLLSGVFKLSAQFQDNFSDGDFTANPVWSGNNAEYIVTGGQLRSNSLIASSSFYLSTPSVQVNDCQWEFWCNLQFNTSSLNYADIYLLADQSNLMVANLNGYFVRIGNTLDEVCLYKNTSGTVTKIIDGFDGTTNSSNTLLKVKVVRSINNQFLLFTDFSGTGTNYSLEGSVTDNSFLNSVSFGILLKQSTSSFFQKHFFDDFYVGPIINDTIPPVCSSAVPTTATTLDLLFSEALDTISAQNNSNYLVNNGIGNPATSQVDAVNPALVHLSFSTSFSSGLQYTVSINSLKDTSGNVMLNSQNLSFVFYNLGIPVFKDVIINEIMADPNPSVGSLPLVEWVEIYNVSTKTFDLSSWKFADASSIATLNNKYLLPGNYIILCKNADTASLSIFGPTCGMSSMPSLNDAGDNIYLKDNLGNVIDSVNYSSSWYNDPTKSGGGWSLELINPGISNSCSPSVNWSATQQVNGGTPGSQNSIYSVVPDLTGPIPLQVTVVDSLHITVCFNEQPVLSQLLIPANFFISGGIGSPVLCSSNPLSLSCVDLQLSVPLQNLTNYLLSFSNLSDCSGNSVSPSTFSFSYYIPGFHDLVIDEIMADPDPAVGLPAFEFIELHNRSAFPIGLKNFSISSPTTTKLLPDVTILPDSFFVFTGTSGYQAYSGFGISVAQVSSFPALTNTGSTITLKNPQGKIIHSVTYSDTWYQDPLKSEGGFSLEMIDADNPCAGAENWKASMDISGGTPGKRNSVNASNPDIIHPKLSRISVISSDTIQLYFSEKTDSISLLNSNLYQIDQGIGQPLNVIPIANDFKSVRLVLPASLQVGIIYTCTLFNGIKDCAGNPINSPDNVARFAVPLSVSIGDVVINEILFDPKSDGVDFVELYNRSQKTIDLSTLWLGEMDTLTNTLNDLQPLSSEGFLMFPSEYVVLSESGAVVKSQYQTTNPSGFLDVVDLPAMNTGGDVVTLSDPVMQVIDQVIYSESMHFDLLNDTKGVSLERIDFNRSSSDKTNWNSAASSVGFATPAYRNSQYLQSNVSGNVSVSPEVFSPDNDGYNDVLNISYQFENPGQVVNIYLFDASGKLIRRLIRNETVAQMGTFSWNGLTDNGEKASIGIYVIYFESYDATGQVQAVKRTCVLGGKL